MTVLDEATRRQTDAARPDASTWLSANAGSGKTRVLTDRVARLLLDGVEPQHILCLTYTKAAASEMQNRLFKRLGAWAMLEDADLRQSLSTLGVRTEQSDDDLRRARTLFASAIETPGGLKIQTIHSFCAALLRRFPLEAGVSPQFKEVEERAADLLQAEIVDDMAAGDEAGLVQALATHYTGEEFEKLTREITRNRHKFTKDMPLDAILDAFGQGPGSKSSDAWKTAFDRTEDHLIAQVTPILHQMSATMVTLAKTLDALDLKSPNRDTFATLCDLFLRRSDGHFLPDAKTGSIPTKKAQDALGPLVGPFHDFMERVATAKDMELAIEAANRTFALHQFATRFVQHYENAKLLRGWLDFDDLISKARQLLSDPKVAAWVLYKIDGGIDHILVDEAQDTSPEQWMVVRKLAEEFSSGEGANPNTLRTLFVVGDTKQSIYSFQGADPKEFNRMQAEFKDRFQGAGLRFQERTLDYSFRSSPAILRLVDTCFDPALRPGFSNNAQHIAFKSDLPGRVDLWPVVEKTKPEDDGPWYDPVDRVDPTHHDLILAERVAQQIKDLIAGDETIPEDGPKPGTLQRRSIRPGDFLILVQRRSRLFSEIIRACKSLGLPIAGADRLKVGAELAVKDLGALLSFLATPEDDLSLAAALRSPLFNWSEQDLFDLAHRRGDEFLWQALRDRRDIYPDTYAVLQDMRDNADFLRPYDLIERLLTRHDGRRKLLARLGTEAEDGIDALLGQALAFERSSVPSLTGFTIWMKTDDIEIKRQIDSASDQIRVMTVHGAKGLEAPIVILPDTAKRDISMNDNIVDLDEVAIWKPKSALAPNLISTRLEEMKSDIARERLRLLYVALTRAEKWLIVAAAGELDKNGDSWFQIVESAMQSLNASPVKASFGQILRHSHGDWDQPDMAAHTKVDVAQVTVDPLFAQPLIRPEEPDKTLAPSDLGGAKALPGDLGRSEDEAKAFGTYVHLLLERLAPLPQSNWPDAITTCRALARGVSQNDLEAAEAQALGVLRNPDLAFLFRDEAMEEVGISATVGHRRIHGSIDRLVTNGNDLLAVDFKSNQMVPRSAQDCPVGLLRQMGAYLVGLEQIFPDRNIKTAIVWTRSSEIMYLDNNIVTRALWTSPDLDVNEGGS